MNSFYGGPSGKDFRIAKVFANKVELQEDLEQRWLSNILPGEYILISYGAQGDTYEANKSEDFGRYKKNYNATLWKKIYIKNNIDKNIEPPTDDDIYVANQDNGLGYRLITILTANTPTFSVNTQEINADESPQVNIDNINKDNPILTFSLPQSQIFNTEVNVETINANQLPEASINYDDPNSINNPQLNLRLPVSQVFNTEVNVEPIDSDEVPIASINYDDPNSINKPQLNLSLPRSINFYYGTFQELSGQNTNNVIISNPESDSNISKMYKNDYYINLNSGAIYKLQSIEDSNYTFMFIAKAVPKVELIEPTYINPFTDDLEYNKPQISVNMGENGINNFHFSLLNQPILTQLVNFIGPEQKGSIAGKILNSSTYQYTFEIPRGSRIFTAESTDFVSEEVKIGDYLLILNKNNEQNGNIYKYNGTNWETKIGSILGPIGNALKIVGTADITLGSTKTPNTQEIVQTIEDVNKYLDQLNLNLQEDELYIVNITDTNEEEISYWYSYIDNNWTRTKLTGGISGILVGNKTLNDDDKAYNITYINNLENTINSKLEDINNKLSWGTF